MRGFEQQRSLPAPAKGHETNTTVGIAKPEDRELLVPLVLSFRDHLQQPSPSESEVASSLKRLLADPATDFIVAVSDERAPVGYAQVRYRYSLWVVGSEAQLDDLFVVPRSRQSGLGSRLLEIAVAQARKRSCQVIGLSTNERNAEALRLYTRAGFSAVRESWQAGRQLWLERAITPNGWQESLRSDWSAVGRDDLW